MVLSCFATCAKYCIYVFNVIFFLGGLGTLGVGIWMVADTAAIHTLVRVSDAIRGDDGSYSGQLQNELTPGVLAQSGWILICAGTATLFFSFLGCCGAIRESQCLLSLYAVSLMLVFGLEVAAGVYAYVAKNNFEESARSVMMLSLTDEYMNGSSNAITFGWNRMMADLECCGVFNFRDFQQARFWRQSNSQRQQLPRQCCKLKDKKYFIPVDETCVQYPTVENSNMYKGCYDALKVVLQTNLTVLIYVGIGVGASQIIGIILTIILCCAVDRDK